MTRDNNPFPGGTITVQVEPKGDNIEYTITIQQPVGIHHDGTLPRWWHNATFRHVTKIGSQGFGFKLTEEGSFWTLRDLPSTEAKD